MFIKSIVLCIIGSFMLSTSMVANAVPRPDIWDDINQFLSSLPARATNVVDAGQLQDILNGIPVPGSIGGNIPVQVEPFTVVYGGGDSGIPQETLVLPVPNVRVVQATATATVADVAVSTEIALSTTVTELVSIVTPTATLGSPVTAVSTTLASVTNTE